MNNIIDIYKKKKATDLILNPVELLLLQMINQNNLEEERLFEFC